MRDIKALDHMRGTGQVKCSPKVSRFQGSPPETELDVGVYQIEELLLLADLWHGHLNLRSFSLRQVFDQCITGFTRKDQFCRGYPVGIVLHQEFFEKILACIKRVLLFSGKQPLFYRKYYQKDRIIRKSIRNDVLVGLFWVFHMLPFCKVLDGTDLVAQGKRFLEILSIGPFRHLRPQRFEQLAPFSLQEYCCPIDLFVVILLADHPNAGGTARLHVVPEARPPGEFPAGSQAEDLFYDPEHLIALSRRDKRPKIMCVAFARAPCYSDAGERIARDLDICKPFCIF